LDFTASSFVSWSYTVSAASGSPSWRSRVGTWIEIGSTSAPGASPSADTTHALESVTTITLAIGEPRLYEGMDRSFTMITREQFGMAELVERTGVPAPSIHHYLRMGLLPRPKQVATNRFAYDRRHEQALLLIRLLRERRRLSLQVIRRVLPQLL